MQGTTQIMQTFLIFNAKMSLFYRSHHVGDPKIQAIFSQWAKREKQPVNPKILPLVLEPEAHLLPPPPSPEMMDLDSCEAEE